MLIANTLLTSKLSSCAKSAHTWTGHKAAGHLLGRYVYKKGITMKWLMIIFLFIFSLHSHAEDMDIENKINSVNKISEETLGISLIALSYLVTAHPHSYLTYDYMEDKDKAAIKELENAGYVRTVKSNGLPDGTHNDMTYIRVIPNHRGTEVQRCMLALQKKITFD